MNASAECRVPVCRLLNHGPIVNRSAIFFFFFFFFFTFFLFFFLFLHSFFYFYNQYKHLKWHTCVKKYDKARVCNNRCDKFMTSGLIDLTLQFNLRFPIPFKLQYVRKSHIKTPSLLSKTGSVGLVETHLFLSHMLVAGCYTGVRFSVRPSVRLSTFMSTFDIYVKVSILIKYKTKQPSNFA